MTPSAPTSEKGALQSGNAGWSTLIDDIEHAPQLQWPLNLPIYRQMRTDAQVDALYRGTTYPVRRFQYSIAPNGAPDKAVADLAEDLNLPIQGDDSAIVRRRKGRFSFKNHLKWSLEAMIWGHYYFEQVGKIENNQWRLKKLAPRPARIIESIDVDHDGGLKSIKVPSAGGGGQFASLATIDVDRLVAYVWDQEPGHWTGMSMFRSIYKNWLLKDRLIRIDLIKHDRAGAGMPLAEAPPGATGPQIEALDRMARSMRVDEEGGGAVPHGTDMRLMGITGTVPDTWDSIRGHNEEMANAWLSQVAKLGQTASGSRALGETLMPALHEFQDTIAGWFCDVFNEHVIEDWIDWNYGPDTLAPQLVYDRPDDKSLAVADLATMVENGMVEVDDELETWLRQNFRMPSKGTPRTLADPDEDDDEPSPPGSPTVEAKRRRSGRVKAAGESPTPSLPDRSLRRDPYPHEIQAAVDWSQMEDDFLTMSEELREKLMEAQAIQLDDLEGSIKAAGNDLDKLAAIETEPLGIEDIEAVMKKAAEAGIESARAEAVAQGVASPDLPDVDEDAIAQRARAAAELLSRSLAEATSREAVRRAGSASPEALAAATKEYMLSLSGSHVAKQSRGAVTRATNLGRLDFMAKNKPVSVYASELLDGATCEFCVAIDGTVWATVEEARDLYPSGFIDCQGGENCRGTLVAIYSEEAAPSLDR